MEFGMPTLPSSPLTSSSTPHPVMTHTLDWVETLARATGGGLGISKTVDEVFPPEPARHPWRSVLGRVGEEKDFWLRA